MLEDITKEELTNHFLQGACSAFAVALAERTGYQPFITFQYNESLKADGDCPWEIYHAFVRNPQGKAIDVQGVHKERFARINGASLRGMRTQPVTIGELQGWHDRCDEDLAHEVLNAWGLDRFV